MIELRVLGEIRLVSDDGRVVDTLLRQPKRLALLAYLAAPAPGTWHRRDMLLALFWPELDTAHARTSLRNALYSLRQSLGESVLRTRGDEEISIDPDALRTDLAAVLEALRAGRTDEALAEYRGELLPGLIPPESDGFMRWLDTERTRLKVSMAVSATARADELEREGDIAGALAVTRRVMEIEPHDERAVRRLMSLHERLGDRAGALAAFESYRALLASDFEAEPAPETMEMVTRLRAPAPLGAPKPPVAPAPRVAAGAVTPTAPHIPPAERVVPRRSRVRAAVTAVVALVVLATIARGVTRVEQPLSVGKSTPLTADEGLQVEAVISPNGRLVAYAKGNARLLQIFVQKIDGGAPWRLTGDSSTEMMPRWSPDNDQLLYLAHDNAYVAPSIGGSPRLVARGTPGDGKVWSASWSPAGDSVVIARNDSLLVLPLRGSGTRLVATAPSKQLHSCVWSPATPWIACVSGNLVSLEAGPLFGNVAPSAILLYPAAGGAAVDLTGNAFEHRSPAWSADGRFLWLLSDRDGESGAVYAAAIGRDGRASRSFERVGLKSESIGLTANRMTYSVPVRYANIWAVPIPGEGVLAFPAVGTPITSGRQLIELLSVSGDGKWITYDSNIRGNADLYRIPVAGGTPEQLTDDPRGEYAGVLSPDGSTLAWQRFVNGKRRLFVRQLDSATEVPMESTPDDEGGPQWSPDGKSIAAWNHDRETGKIFVVHRDANGHWAPAAWRLKGGQLPRWSPDGKTLAFLHFDGAIETISADSGARTPVYTPRAGTSDPRATGIVWHRRDPTTIWFIGVDRVGHSGIWSVPASGGAARLRVNLDNPSGVLPGPTFGTDGSRFYFTLDERFSNLRWAELVKR